MVAAAAARTRLAAVARSGRCARWGPKPEDWVSQRVVGAAEVAVGEGAEVVVLPCNTATVSAVDAVRERLGASIPVIGTVPAIACGSRMSSSVAIWATAANTAAAYQADLVEQFGNGAEVVGVACLGLAEAIDRRPRRRAECYRGCRRTDT